MREQGDWVVGLLVGLAVEREERRTKVRKHVAWWLQGGRIDYQDTTGGGANTLSKEDRHCCSV